MDIASVPPRQTAAFGPDQQNADGENAATAAADQLPLWRLYALRAVYLYLGVGLAVTRWPAFLLRDQPLPLMEGVVDCILVALSLLFLLGIRYPTRMLPLLLFESAWKLAWLATVALPLWTTDRMTPAFGEMTSLMFWVAPVLVLMPWPHVLSRYVRHRGDRWRREPGTPTP